MKYLSNIILCIALFTSGALTAQQSLVNKVIAKVGGELVLLSDLEEQIAYLEDQGETIRKIDRCDLLEGILAQKLLVNQAKLDSIVVQEEQVQAQIDGRIEQILGMMNNDIGQFESYYGKTVEEVREQMSRDMKNQMLAEQMREKVMSRAEATPSQVIEFFKNMPKDSLPYYNSEVELQELVIKPQITEEERVEAIALLQNIREKILSDSASFTEMARLYSDDPGSARNGGDLGMMKRGSFVPAYEAAAYNLQSGEISEVVESEFGFHIIKLIERRGNNIHTQHVLIQPEITKADINRTIGKADSLVQLIRADSITFESAVRLHGHDKVQSYNNSGRMVNNQSGDSFFEVGDLEPDQYFAIDTLEVGGLTDPFVYRNRSGDKMIRVLKLNSRTEPHQASLSTDYAKIQKLANEQKQGETLMQWMRKIRDKTYIQVDSDFDYCDNLDKWRSDGKEYGAIDKE